MQNQLDSINPSETNNWARIEESAHFSKMLKLYRQNKLGSDSFRRFRLQHGAYGTRMTDDYAMVRIKIPAGEIHPNQLIKIAQLCDSFSIGSAHVSTRQNIQLHWVVLEDVPEIMAELAKVGLTTREACGNTIRNIMCSPLSGVCTNEMFDSTPYALALAKFLLRNPLNQNLPRKFKFNFTCCEQHGMARIVDVGLVPIINKSEQNTQQGFKVFLGGGLGNKSYVGHQLEEFTPIEDLLYTSIAVIKIFDRLGNRKNLARNRMRYLVHELGWDEFKKLILKERAIIRVTQSIITNITVNHHKHIQNIPKFNQNTNLDSLAYTRWLKTNTIKQKQQNYYSVFLTLEAGDITSDQLRHLANICKEFSGERLIRNGFSQDVVIRWVHQDHLQMLYSKLISVGLSNPGAMTIASPIGCSGTTSCNLALTNSHRLAKEIQRKLLTLKIDQDDDLKDATIKISGCPNSCGQHEIATIGFYGGGGRSGKNMYPIYQMSLGGRSDDDAMLGVNCLRIPAKKVIDTILKIISIFKKDKKPDDDLKSWINKIVNEKNDTNIRSISDLKKLLLPFTKVPDKTENSDFYYDYGSFDSYHTRTGKGECAA
ncbi:MAG: nitrite/sulfite reductase [Thaumarchaeota archaeon]|nr:nitrite/sulfite reductase [Nitrososphaerota archaeon]